MPDLDQWIDAVMSDYRASGSAMKFAWHVRRCLLAGATITQAVLGKSHTRRVAAHRGAERLEHLGFLDIERRRGRPAIYRPRMPARAREAAE